MLKKLFTTKRLTIVLGVMLFFLFPHFAFADGGTTTQPFTTTYKIDFQGEWTQANNHPAIALPGNAHFSPLIGAVHNSDIKFWEPGQLATPGVEDTAELGETDDFTTEINTELNENPPDALERIFLNSSNIDNVGSTTISPINVNKDYPLMTVISMIAPSSDWFVGIRDQSTLDGNNRWKESFSIDLAPYDAGTEQDTILFSLGNSPEVPHKNISNIAGGSVFNTNRMGTITITRINFSDLHINKNVAPQTNVAFGGTVTYTVTLSNTGDIAANGVVFSDTLPAGFNFGAFIPPANGATHNSGVISWSGNIGSGAQITFTYVGTYLGTAFGQSVSNTAQFSHSSAAGINSGQASASFIVQAAPSNPALTVQKTPNVSEASVGETITYTYRITNTGDIMLAPVSAVDDKLGSITLSKTILQIGEVATGSKSYVVQSGDLPGPLMNTVTVTVPSPGMGVPGVTVTGKASVAFDPDRRR